MEPTLSSTTQAIYSFRGADPTVFNAFRRHVDGVTTVTLRENYRSSGAVLKAASAVVGANAHRVKKDVFTRAPLGTPVEVCECRNAAAEVDWLAVRLLALQTVRRDRPRRRAPPVPSRIIRTP